MSARVGDLRGAGDPGQLAVVLDPAQGRDRAAVRLHGEVLGEVGPRRVAQVGGLRHYPVTGAGSGHDEVADLRPGAPDDDLGVDAGGRDVGGRPLGVAPVGDEREPFRPDHHPAERASEPGQPAHVGRSRHEEDVAVQAGPHGGRTFGVPDRREGRHWSTLYRCERVSASERAASNGLRGRGTP